MRTIATAHRAARGSSVLAVAALLLAAAGCNWGTRPEKWEPARTAAGARIAVRVQGEPTDRIGELYAADSLGVTLRLLAGERRIVRVAWTRLAALDVHQLGDRYDVRFGASVDADRRRRLALVSRFPQGLAGPLLERVLAAAAQPALEEIR